MSTCNGLASKTETSKWLSPENKVPSWSRLKGHNRAQRKWKDYDIEVNGSLWSLWGDLHPQAAVFSTISRGKQYLACEVMCCCALSLYPISNWNGKLLNEIIISGDKYHSESFAKTRTVDFEFSLEHLNTQCKLSNILFTVHLEHVVFGELYAQSSRKGLNLSQALEYFFQENDCGILQCNAYSLAFGRTNVMDGVGFFMFDCMSRDAPLFSKGQGAAYVLLMRQMHTLLYCMVLTLNIRFNNIAFSLHKVDVLAGGAHRL